MSPLPRLAFTKRSCRESVGNLHRERQAPAHLDLVVEHLDRLRGSQPKFGQNGLHFAFQRRLHAGADGGRFHWRAQCSTRVATEPAFIRLELPKALLYLRPMPFRVVFVRLPILFVGGLLMRAVAIRLVLREAAHADEDRLSLRFDFQRLVGGFQDFSHIREDSSGTVLASNAFFQSEALAFPERKAQ